MKQWLKQTGFLSSVLVILGLLFCMQCALGLVGKGAVRLPRKIDAGTAKSGAIIKCAIRMQNLTPLPILIFSETSCSCSVVDHASGTISPFGSYSTNIEINTTNFPAGEGHKSAKMKFQYANRSWEDKVDLNFHIN